MLNSRILFGFQVPVSNVRKTKSFWRNGHFFQLTAIEAVHNKQAALFCTDKNTVAIIVPWPCGISWLALKSSSTPYIVQAHVRDFSAVQFCCCCNGYGMCAKCDCSILDVFRLVWVVKCSKMLCVCVFTSYRMIYSNPDAYLPCPLWCTVHCLCSALPFCDKKSHTWHFHRSIKSIPQSLL